MPVSVKQQLEDLRKLRVKREEEEEDGGGWRRMERVWKTN